MHNYHVRYCSLLLRQNRKHFLCRFGRKKAFLSMIWLFVLTVIALGFVKSVYLFLVLRLVLTTATVGFFASACVLCRCSFPYLGLPIPFSRYLIFIVGRICDIFQPYRALPDRSMKIFTWGFLSMLN